MAEQESLAENPEASGRVLFAVALAAGLLLRVVALGTPDLFGPDEGPWAISARNVAEGGFDQFLDLSRTPLGPPSGTPVFFPFLLSLMIQVFGAEEWAIRLPSAGAGLIAAFALERVVRRGYGQPAGHVAGAFAALFAPLVLASRAATVETTLTALGLAGMIFGLRAFEEDLPWEAALSGVCFGLGFLSKGTAISFFLVPLLLALIAHPSVFSLGHTRLCLAIFLGTMGLIGGSHLVLIAVFRPEALHLTLTSAFGMPAVWHQPEGLSNAFNADLKELVRALFMFLPLAGVGFVFLFRPLTEAEVLSGATEGSRRLSHGVLYGTYALEFLIPFAVSDRMQLSSIPVIPALAAFAGLGAAAFMAPAESARRRRSEGMTAIAVGLGVILLGAYLMSRPGDPFFGKEHVKLSAGSVLISIAGATTVLCLLAFGVFKARTAKFAVFIYISGLLAIAAMDSKEAIRRDLLSHRTFARETADQIAPLILPLHPAQFAFRAPDPDAIAFRLFRTGKTWRDIRDTEHFEDDITVTKIRAFAFDKNAAPGSSAPPAGVEKLLETKAQDVTQDVEARAGRPVRIKVFVAPPNRPPRS